MESREERPGVGKGQEKRLVFFCIRKRRRGEKSGERKQVIGGCFTWISSGWQVDCKCGMVREWTGKIHLTTMVVLEPIKWCEESSG